MLSGVFTFTLIQKMLAKVPEHYITLLRSFNLTGALTISVFQRYIALKNVNIPLKSHHRYVTILFSDLNVFLV